MINQINLSFQTFGPLHFLHKSEDVYEWQWENSPSIPQHKKLTLIG